MASDGPQRKTRRGDGRFKRLAADGADVAFTYAASIVAAERLQPEVAAMGATAIGIQADSADREQVAAAVDNAASQFDGIDILVNNAGATYTVEVEAFSLDMFDRMLAVNVRAVFTAIDASYRTGERTLELLPSAAFLPTTHHDPAARSTR